MTAPQPDQDPAAELLAIAKEREARNERRAKEARGCAILFLVVMVLLLVIVVLASRG